MATQPYSIHIRDILKLAYPVSLGQVGIMIAGLADNIMVGQIGYKYLAASSFANAIQVIFLLFGTGFAIAITPIVGQALGAKDEEKIRDTFRDGLTINTIVGVVLCLFMFSLQFFLDYFGQEDEVVVLARPYFVYLALTIVPHMIFMHFKQFTEGMQKTFPAMVIGLLGNALNIALNYVLIYGKFGFPRMELNGAGLATLLFRVFIVLAFFGYFFFEPKYRKFLDELRNFVLKKAVAKNIIKTGVPIGAQFSMEAGIFAVAAIMIGWIGSVAQAAHQIAINLATTTYLAASGISSAATIKISKLLGEKKYQDLRRTGYSSFMIVTVFMAVMAIVFIVFRHTFPTYFVQEQNVIDIAAQLLVVAAIFQLVDGIQVVGLGTQRGLMDVQFPTFMAVVAFWILGIPTSYVLGIHFELGAIGVWVGIALGLGTAAIGLFLRFYLKTKSMR